jgi:hypothetical protein
LPVSQGFPLVPAKITGFDYGLNCIVYIHSFDWFLCYRRQIGSDLLTPRKPAPD